jgi:hypothetical protein
MRLFAILLLTALAANAASTYYVSTTGGTGTGAIGDPWSMSYGIGASSPATAGDTIYLRGGTYAGGLSSAISGTGVSPISIKPYQAERPIIESSVSYSTVGLTINGSNTWWYGIEVWNSNTGRTNVTDRGAGFWVLGPGTKVINNIVHDCGIGIAAWEPAIGTEIYGNVIYNNGWQNGIGDNGHAHAIYTQNDSGTRVVHENIMLNGFQNGFQAYGQSGNVVGYDLQRNISYCNGAINLQAAYAWNYTIGGILPASNIVVSNNVGYFPQASGGNQLSLGYTFGSSSNANSLAYSNYLAGGISIVKDWTNCTFQGNTLIGANYVMQLTNILAGAAYVFEGNTYITTSTPMLYQGSGRSAAQWQAATGLDATSTWTSGSPSGTHTFTCANAYETGRGHVAVFNWGLADNVSVDVSSIVPVSYVYTVRNASDYYGAVVKTGTYSGGTISLPMTNLTVAVPVKATVAPATGPEFNAFVITSVPGTAISTPRMTISGKVTLGGKLTIQ